jgi:hypothetical protein
MSALLLLEDYVLNFTFSTVDCIKSSIMLRFYFKLIRLYIVECMSGGDGKVQIVMNVRRSYAGLY